MKRGRFEQLVEEALALLPGRFRKALKNVAIVVEDAPSPELLAEMGIDPPDTLLGLYQGTPLTERGWSFGNAVPDRILIFQEPIEEESESDEEVRIAVAETVLHELGHYFGMEEDEIEEIEERYWGHEPRED